jgi:hypothetical protein
VRGYRTVHTKIMRNSLRIASAFGLLAACSLSRAAQPPLPAIDGEYKLASSTTAPISNWSFSKAHVSIRKLDDRHVVILFACEWKREPKAACDDYYFAQWREGGLYIQDMNTDSMRMYFDPASRTLTMISRAVDAKASVRRDVFTPADGSPQDAPIARRLKRAQSNSVSKENIRVFGAYSKWKYETNRIEFQNSAP